MSSKSEASRIDRIADGLFGNRRLESKSTTHGTYTMVGTATGDSSGGKVEVFLGEQTLTQDNDGTSIVIPTNVNVKEGDTVQVSYGHGAMQDPTVTGVIGGGDRMAIVAETAKKAATEAEKAVTATHQHFYDDYNGVHVTTEAEDDTTGANLLANSQGVLLRNGETIMSAQTPSGFTVYDGNGNEPSNVVATFGESITVGRERSHIVITKNGIDFSGEPILAPPAYGDPNYAINVDSMFHVESTNMRTIYLEDGSVGVGSRIGYYPFLRFGKYTDDYLTAGDYTSALGCGVRAPYDYTTAIGKHNLGGYKLFEIGNGTSDTKRSNAFDVGFEGDAHVYRDLTVDGNATAANVTTDGAVTANTIASGDIASTGTITATGNITSNGAILDTPTKKDAVRNTSTTKGGWCSFIKSGHVVKVKCFIKMNVACASYSAVNTLFTGLPKAAFEEQFGYIKIDNSTGTVLGIVDTSGVFKLNTRETALTTSSVLYGSFEYISSE